MNIWILLLFLVIGVVFGSFVNAVVFRLHHDESIAKGRSKCRSCEQPIFRRDLIPVMSYFLLKGKCRHCKKPFSWQYPAVEAVLGVLFALVYVRYATRFALPADYLSQEMWWFIVRDCVFLVYLAILFIYDLRYMLILDRVTIPAMIVALMFGVLLGLPVVSLFVGGLVIGGFFALQFVVSKGMWIGGGDIRLGLLMGFMLGLRDGLVALFLAYVLGAVIGVALLVAKKVDRKTPIPFGVFLAIGTVLTLFFGELLIHYYLSLFV